MKISESTIADIAKRRDSSTLYEIARTLVANLNQRDSELEHLRKKHERLKALSITTELDKDRFRVTANERTGLSAESGLSENAAQISDRHGTSGGPEGEISIYLD